MSCGAPKNAASSSLSSDKSSGTSPNLAGTSAGSNSPNSGSAVRENATAPALSHAKVRAQSIAALGNLPEENGRREPLTGSRMLPLRKYCPFAGNDDFFIFTQRTQSVT